MANPLDIESKLSVLLEENRCSVVQEALSEIRSLRAKAVELEKQVLRPEGYEIEVLCRHARVHGFRFVYPLKSTEQEKRDCANGLAAAVQDSLGYGEICKYEKVIFEWSSNYDAPKLINDSEDDLIFDNNAA